MTLPFEIADPYNKTGLLWPMDHPDTRLVRAYFTVLATKRLAVIEGIDPRTKRETSKCLQGFASLSGRREALELMDNLSQEVAEEQGVATPFRRELSPAFQTLCQLVTFIRQMDAHSDVAHYPGTDAETDVQRFRRAQQNRLRLIAKGNRC